MFRKDAFLGLNYRLKKSNTKTTVVAFVIMPAASHSYTIEALKGQAVTKQLRDTVTEIQNRIGARLFEHAMRSNGYVLRTLVESVLLLIFIATLANTALCLLLTILSRTRIKFF